MKLSQYMTEWLVTMKPLLRTSTYEAYTVYIGRHIVPYFDSLGCDLESVTPMQLQRYVNEKLQSGRLDGKSGGLSLVTVRKHLNVMRQAFGDAIRYSYIETNPAKHVRLPRSHGTYSKRCVFMEAAEAKKLLTVLEPEHEMHLAVMLALLYGLRRSEVLGLRWQSIDFEHNTIEICHTVVKNLTIQAEDATKTECSHATFELLPEVKKALMQHRNEMQHISAYVFARSDGTVMRPDTLTRSFQRALARHGFEKMRFHDLRHSTASILFDRGWSIEDVKQWLRHSDFETTSNIYLHYNRSRKVLVGRNLSELLTGTE